MKKEFSVKNHTRQTRLGVSIIRKDKMTTISNIYPVDGPYLMRHANSGFVQIHNDYPQDNGKLTFV